MIITTQARATLEAPTMPFQPAAATKPEAEPEFQLCKMSAVDVSPKSSLIELVIFVVFSLMASGILIDSALERFHLVSADALFQMARLFKLPL
jgi:hypothetical protein